MTSPPRSQPDNIDEKIERDRQRREDAAFGHRKPIFQRKPLTADTHWWEH